MTSRRDMLRIHQTLEATSTTLVLEGKLLAPWAGEVRLVAANALARGPVRLDLAGLAFADTEGVATLQTLRQAGIEFVHVSGFIDNLLTLLERTK